MTGIIKGRVTTQLLSGFVTVSGLLVIGLSSSIAFGVPQNQELPTASEQECGEELAPGRPVLKRRGPAPEVQPDARPSSEKGPDPKCKQVSRTNIVNAGIPVRIEFLGLHAFNEVELLKTLREERNWRIPASLDRMPDSEERAKAATSLREWYQARGYMGVVVDVLGGEDSKSVTFLINEGARSPIAELRFEGCRVFSSQDLAAKVSKYLANYEVARDGYNAAALEYSLSDVTNFVRTQGYLQAKLGAPKTELAGNGLVITVAIEEGPLYRLGEITIEGSQYLSPRQIRALLRLQRGDVANGEAIAKWLFEDLKKIYGEAGYVEYTAEPTPQFTKTPGGRIEGIVDLEVTIEEGKQFTLRSIEVLGAHIPKTALQDLLLIHEGDVYNQRLFEQSVVKLNQTRLFEEIDKDKDTDFKTNDEEGLVDIVIKVRKAAP